MKPLSYRQIHLDFHTSACIPDIGADFSRENFAAALKAGHVSSITLFSKCHHGYAYHPSTANEIHPGLHFDLLGEELAVCRELGINAPVYISAGHDEKEADRHPEWVSVSAPGQGPDYVNKAYYKLLCYNTPYLDLLLSQIEEVMQRYHPSGIFLDISAERTCYCASCVRSMREKGLNPQNPADVKEHGKWVYANYCRRVEEVVRKYDKETTIFHNAGNIARGRRDIAHFDTHLELESLPTGGWGYDHFPMSAAYVRTLGMEFLGMTGKFHTTWGEFGGFKHPNALRYEAALSIALGAKCSIGDQMHPSGEMNLSTYRLIGAAYKEVEEKEPWCRGAKAVTDIAVLSSEAVNLTEGRHNAADIGACRMLLEGKYLFDLIDLETAFSAYKLLILPDDVPVDEALASRLNAFTAQGGKLLLSGRAGLNPQGTAFAVETGALWQKTGAFTPSYMVPGKQTVMTNGETSYVMYTENQEIEPKNGAEVFAYAANPYFNRTPEHFSSHQHTPDVPGDRHPAAVYFGSTAYIGWNIFSDYATKGSLVLKELALHAIEHLIGKEKTASVQGLPDRGVFVLNRQEEENRLVAHLLFAHTTLRGEKTEVIEDVVPLYGVKLCVKCAQPKAVKLVPAGENLPFAYANGEVQVTIPKMELHAMVEITL